jgi:hypothetical protein
MVGAEGAVAAAEPSFVSTKVFSDDDEFPQRRRRSAALSSLPPVLAKKLRTFAWSKPIEKMPGRGASREELK